MVSINIYFVLFLIYFFSPRGSSSDFTDNFEITWGKDHLKLSNNGQMVELCLDRASGSGFQSKNKFLFGSFTMQIKLVSGNSPGTVTAFYMSSNSTSHDEIDYEFLGNLPGKPYILQTNIFVNGVGNREQRIRLWFDPSADFHNYSILWNHKQIVFFVDSIPIRVFKNNEGKGVPYLKNQPMNIISSLWNGGNWTTDGGRVKIDWSKAPFVSLYQGFQLDGCEASKACVGKWWDQPEFQKLSGKQLRWVRKHYMLYDYCNDKSGRFPTVPSECNFNP